MQATVPEFFKHASSEATSGRTTGPTFALVDCYTGGNLGDGAIQDAVIWNIRQRFPDAAIYGITLHPADTLQRHGIPSYLLAGRRAAELPRNLVADPPVQPAPADGQQPAGNESVGRRLCEIPGGGGGWGRPISAASRLALDHPTRVELHSTELRHIIGGYRFLKNVDILIISGGGQLQDIWGGPWGHPYAMLKWTFLARLRGAKPIFLSVGFFRARRPFEPVLHPQGSFPRRIQVVSRSRIPRTHETCRLPPGRPGVPGPGLQSSVRWLPPPADGQSWPARRGCESVVPSPPSYPQGKSATIRPTKPT